MLHASKPLTSGKVQSYYRSEYSSASNSYFTQGGTLKGEWHGQLSSELGLSGHVSGEAFDRLAEGQHPQTGEQLIKHRDTIKTRAGEEVGHRAGWDLTFNAPKTVSLTALVGEDERVREAHRSAVRTSLDAMEAYVQARMGGNNPAETTGKWIAATFEHDTARPVNNYPAPHLHTHVLVFNMTEDVRGQARSLQPYELFKVQSMATAIYQNELQHQLRQLGYQIERGTNHAPDIKGYSAEYIQAESLRSAQIAREMAERGLTGRDAGVQLAHQNREDKLKLTPDELRAIHKTHAAEFGNQPRNIVTESLTRQAKELPTERIEAKAQSAVTFARERLSERNAVFEHFEVVRDALRHTHGKARLKDIEPELSRQVQDGKFIAVEHVRPNAPAARYTTPQLIEIERETIERVRAGQGKAPSPIHLTYAEVEQRFGGKLNDDQARLIRDALVTTDQVFGVQGGAGTGKTTALAAINELAQEQGYKTHGLGPTSRAAKGLKEAGIDSETLQAYLTKGRGTSDDSRPQMYFVDESSLASGKQMRDFLQTIRPEDRVLLIGDVRQHQAVEAGRIFEELQQAGMGVAKLEKIVRQKDDGLRQVVEAMASGKTAEGVALLGEQNRIHAIEHRQERFQAIARDFAAAPDGTLVVSPDNKSRQELNSAIRAELRNTGALKDDAYHLPVLINRQDVTGEDRKVASSYRIGDSVRYLRGSEALGLEPKSYATVIQVDGEQNQITVKKPDGKFVTYDPARVKGVTIYEPEMRSFAEGDRVQFTAPWKAKAVSTRDMATVAHLDEHGNMAVRLDDSGRVVAWNLNQNKHVDHAYAMTSYSSQGATVDRVLIQVDTADTKTRSLVDQTLAYVATSRPRYDAQVYTDSAEDLGAALSRNHEKPQALSTEQIDSYAMAV